MKKPDLFLLEIKDFDGITILKKLILTYENLSDPYFKQLWYLKNYIGIDEMSSDYTPVFTKMDLEIVVSEFNEIDLLNSIKTLIN